MNDLKQPTDNVKTSLETVNKKLNDIDLAKEFEKTEEKLKTDAEDMQEAFRKVFEEELVFIDYSALKGLDTNSEEYKKALFEIYDKQIKDLLEISYGTDVYASQIQEILAKQQGLGYVPEADPKELSKWQVKLNEDLSATAELFGELGNVLENDLLNALSSTINGIGAIAKLQQGMALGDIGKLAGGLGIASAVIGIAGPIISSLNKSDVDDKRAEANEKFEKAVETFKKTIDDMNLSQRVGFANLTMPQNLTGVGVSAGKEGITLQETLISSFFWYEYRSFCFFTWVR